MVGDHCSVLNPSVWVYQIPTLSCTPPHSFFPGPVEPTPGGKQGVETQGAPVYSEMWFILLLVFLGLLVWAVRLGLVLRRALRKEPFIRERPPLVPLQKRSQAGGDAYMVRERDPIPNTPYP